MDQYSAAMEPLLPDFTNQRLSALSRQVYIEAGALRTVLPASRTRESMAALLREMNCYYSNLIEGHKTYPREIEAALTNHFATDVKLRLNQHLSRAHIQVQSEMEDKLRAEPGLNIYDGEFIKWLHGRFYDLLPSEAAVGYTATDQPYPAVKGRFRTFNVIVGAHVPPEHSALPGLMQRFQAVYGNPEILATNALSAIAAAHHRFTWIHPFGDGNGRIARLLSHAALWQQGVDGLGLWTLSRGFARWRTRYYSTLAAADQPRLYDYDGRGPLSAKSLHEFCEFFLETMLDQIKFMTLLLELPGLSRRIADYIHRESGIDQHAERVVRLLKAVLIEGEVGRGQVAEIVGLKSSAARQVTRLCLDAGLLASDTPKGPLYITFPAKVLDAYFPRLFLDLPA